MTVEIVVALIGVIGSIIVATITAVQVSTRATERRLREVESLQSKMDVRVGILWDIYVDDTLREARKVGILKKQSPLQTTGRWREIMPEAIRADIENDIVRQTKVMYEPYDVAVEVYRLHKQELNDLSSLYDIPLKAFFGTIYHKCQREAESRRDI